jgi:hypothetical protein
MKSFCASGTLSGLPRPRPVPTIPPSPIPYSACTIWNPLPYSSSHGSSQMSTRVWTWPNSRHDANAAAPNSTKPMIR